MALSGIPLSKAEDFADVWLKRSKPAKGVQELREGKDNETSS
jgi:hypothetical protein